jgi:predicted O-methyltransferase YrrM
MENAKPKKGRKPKAVAVVAAPIEIVTTETFTEVARHEWNSEDECGLFMASLIKMSNYKTVLEVGVFEGETSRHLINAIPQGGQFVGIDINDYRTDVTKAAMSNAGKSIDFILGNSLDELNKLPHGHFDLIFVDGDHSVHHVLKEFRLIEKLVAKGGVIIYHDTLHLEGPSKIVKFVNSYRYKSVTLNTPEGRGISIIHR